ncbi:hypothetical protein H0H81_001088, partial [Sphagnurus paluster]
AAAAIAGVPLELPAQYEHYVDNNKPEFRAKFPHGKIPALETSDGFLLFESVAIARYVAGLNPAAGLLGKDLQEATLVDQWIHLADLEVDANTSNIGQLLAGKITPYSKPIHTAFAERQLRALRTINEHLASRTFLVGERITLADIYVAQQVRRAATVTIDKALRAELNHLYRHAETIANQPSIKEIFGEIEYVEKALTYVAPAKEKK